jgi:SAM-dependent methyltransferase
VREPTDRGGSEDDVPTFRAEPLLAIVRHLEAALAGGAAVVRLRVLDPDHGRGAYAGEAIELDGVGYRHRPLRAWVDLADRLGDRLATPRPHAPPLVELAFERLAGATSRTPADRDAPDPERYGAGSAFARLARSEEPGFLLDLIDALGRVGLAADARVLDLGVGRGDELALLDALVPGFAAAGGFVGVDHSASAIAAARGRFPTSRARFVVADLGELATLDLGRFDLVLSIATLQSRSVDDRELLRTIVQRHLAPRGALILGVPNCAYADGELLAGARMRNFRQAELGLVIKDVAFYRKYLQQHGRTVYVTGTHELLVTAVAAPGRGGRSG